MPDPASTLATRVRRQAAWCAELDSPLYASLLDSAADDLELDGPVRDVFDGFEDEPGSSALALRFMAAVHHLVLDDTLPQLGAHYPSTGGDGDPITTWPVFLQAVADQQAKIRVLMESGCQTNEVGRCAALFGGFLEVAHRTGRPLRILEVGASAGLNLRWDRYRYESAEGAWGDSASPVRFTHSFVVPPSMSRQATVAERKGCDLHPIDPTSDAGALTLRSFIWADQLGRLALLDGAIEIAREAPVEIEQTDAADFLQRELGGKARGLATIVFHSVFLQYVDDAGRQRIQASLDDAQQNAPRDAPVFHLRLEPGETAEARFEIRLDDELLGTSLAHGTGVRWLVDSNSK